MARLLKEYHLSYPVREPTRLNFDRAPHMYITICIRKPILINRDQTSGSLRKVQMALLFNQFEGM